MLGPRKDRFRDLFVHFGVFVDEGVILLVQQITRETFEGKNFVQSILSTGFVTLNEEKRMTFDGPRWLLHKWFDRFHSHSSLPSDVREGNLWTVLCWSNNWPVNVCWSRNREWKRWRSCRRSVSDWHRWYHRECSAWSDRWDVERCRRRRSCNVLEWETLVRGSIPRRTSRRDPSNPVDCGNRTIWTIRRTQGNPSDSRWSSTETKENHSATTMCSSLEEEEEDWSNVCSTRRSTKFDGSTNNSSDRTEVEQCCEVEPTNDWISPRDSLWSVVELLTISMRRWDRILSTPSLCDPRVESVQKRFLGEWTNLFVFVSFSQAEMRPRFDCTDGFPRWEMIPFIGEQRIGIPLSSAEDQDRWHRCWPLETFVLVIQEKILILQPNNPSIRTRAMFAILKNQFVNTRIPDLRGILRTDETQRSKDTNRSTSLVIILISTCFHWSSIRRRWWNNSPDWWCHSICIVWWSEEDHNEEFHFECVWRSSIGENLRPYPRRRHHEERNAWSAWNNARLRWNCDASCSCSRYFDGCPTSALS